MLTPWPSHLGTQPVTIPYQDSELAQGDNLLLIISQCRQ